MHRSDILPDINIAVVIVMQNFFSEYHFRGSKVIYIGDVYTGRFSWEFLSKSSSSVPSSKSDVDAYADYFVCVGGGTCSGDLCELL